MEQLKEAELGDLASQLDQEVRQGRAVSEEKLKQEQASQYAARASRLAERKLPRLEESDVAVIPYTDDENIELIRGALLTLAETMYASRKAALDVAEAHGIELTIEFGDPGLTLCLDAARAAGGTTMLTQDGTTPATALRFRRSPGNLWSGTFTYILVSFPGIRKQLEVHLGVYVVTANSKVAHECDVAIIDYKEAERSRQARVHPRTGKLVAAIEAKRYSSSPPLGVGRGFLGLAQEMGAKK
ncbi:hypothetical protein [Streptomyces brevispora]|uniref:Restriction endonuclease n=1 Tax=Streptomyces brevispora TaxID=887462 RepID=A0ABZ1G6S7_9ACTN|nr:hypothetical protein [Streptomyces brevispora]WSC14418.1 hypothetical protein OIE64_17285 [Streptomyces brevispora]